jgi:5-methylcytosine-specific restriction endonuclease McrA
MQSANLQSLNEIELLVFSTGYEPLFRTNWQRAMTDVMSGRAEMLEMHEFLTVGTATGNFQLPTKIRMLSGIIKAKIRKSRYEFNRPGKRVLWQRDNGRCQYCLAKVSFIDATVDHVIPRSRGGNHSWINLVIACFPCNQKKGCRTPLESGMHLKSQPVPPDSYVLHVR